VPANTWIPHILPSRFDAASAFVVFDNHRRSDWTPYVVRTDDWGKSWKSLATGDLRGWALSIEQDPVDRDLLFLGTSFGLYTSTDGGADWMHWTQGLPTTEYADLAIHPRDHDLVIATHGRALYVLDDITPLRTMTPATLREPLHLYPSGPARLYHEKAPGGASRAGTGDFAGTNRPYGVQLTYSLNLPGLPLADEKAERDRKEKERLEARKPAPPQQTALKEDPDQEPAAPPPPDPKVRIRISDAAGKLVRTFDGPARLGVNRATWDLGRDAFKSPPNDSRGRPRGENESGPKLPPGTYTVAVKYGEREAKGTVQIVPDPFTRNTDADWQAREAALTRVATLQNAAVTAIDRIKAAQADIDLVLKKLEPADKTKTDDDPIKKDLQKAARDLQKKLKAQETRLYVPLGTKGIIDDRDMLAGRAENIGGSLDSSWDRPNSIELANLDAAEALGKTVLGDINKLFAEDVAAFRKKMADAKIDLLAPREPL